LRDLIFARTLREADDRIVKDERRGGPPYVTDTNSQRILTPVLSVNNVYLVAKNRWLQRSCTGSFNLEICRSSSAVDLLHGRGCRRCKPDLKLDDAVPYRLSRNHFMIENRDGSYYVRDLRSTLGTIVNGQPIGEHFRSDEAPLRAGENEVIAGGVDSRFAFSVLVA
jgi:FHA domain